MTLKAGDKVVYFKYAGDKMMVRRSSGGGTTRIACGPALPAAAPPLEARAVQ